jgi:hypothetical protein
MYFYPPGCSPGVIKTLIHPTSANIAGKKKPHAKWTWSVWMQSADSSSPMICATNMESIRASIKMKSHMESAQKFIPF